MIGELTWSKTNVASQKYLNSINGQRNNQKVFWMTHRTVRHIHLNSLMHSHSLGHMTP